MKKLIFTIILASLLSGCSGQQLMHSALLGANFIDWKQTRYIASHPNEFYEINPIVGKHPSRKRVDTYFITAITLRESIYYFLPNNYKPYWNFFWFSTSGSLIFNNYKVGIKLSF